MHLMSMRRKMVSEAKDNKTCYSNIELKLWLHHRTLPFEI